MKTKLLFAALVAAVSVAACSEATSPPVSTAPPGPDAALVGVWHGSLEYNGRHPPFSIVLQPNGAFYLPNYETGLTRGTWRLEGGRILLGLEADGQAVTFAAVAEGDRISGRFPDGGGDDLPFTVDRSGIWAAAGEVSPASGVWSVNIRNNESPDESSTCGLVLQPDMRAFFTCNGQPLSRGMWRAQPNLSIDISDGDDPEFQPMSFSGSLAGNQLLGQWTYEHGGGAFTATRMQ